MKKNKLILIGGGGHCKSCIDVIGRENRFEIAGIIDLKEKLGNNILNYKIIGIDEELDRIICKYKYFLITIGQIKSPKLRIDLFKHLKELNAILPVVISPQSYVSEHTFIGEGTIVMHKAILNVGSRVGKNCIINTGAIIEHDAVIGDNSHISTGAVVNGSVKIGENTFLGSNSVTRQNINIGKNVVIGAGLKIMKDISNDSFIRENYE